MQTVENGAEILASIAGALGVTDAAQKMEKSDIKEVESRLTSIKRNLAYFEKEFKKAKQSGEISKTAKNYLGPIGDWVDSILTHTT